MNKAQRQRQESPGSIDDKFFRLMVESVTNHAVIGIDLEGRILSWNAGAEKIFGYIEEKLVGNPLSILFTPEDRQGGAPERELVNARTRGSAEDFRWQVRKDGSRFWASGFVNPLRDEAGNLIGYVKVVYDATEKKLSEEAIRDSEADFRAIFELAGTGRAQADDHTFCPVGAIPLRPGDCPDVNPPINGTGYDLACVGNGQVGCGPVPAPQHGGVEQIRNLVPEAWWAGQARVHPGLHREVLAGPHSAERFS